MARFTPESQPGAVARERPFVAVLAMTVVLGLAVGLAGTGLVFLLHLVQHAAYGYDVGSVLDTVNFLEGASGATPLRRVAALAVCGVVAGVGWWAIDRFGRPLVSVEEAVHADDPELPGVTTIAHDLLQIVTVGLGSPLGREVAPRELGATLAAWVTRRTGFSPEQRRLLVACSAGAGLAAVYNVPLGGALFTLEVLLATFRPLPVLCAVLSSGLAALVIKIGLHDPRVYELPPFEVHASLLVWSFVVGPVFGVAARGFARLARAARERAPHGGALIAWCVPTFLGIGLLAVRYPQILGNGRSAAQIGLEGRYPVGLLAVLLVLRAVVTIGSFRAGAKGGMLTPSLAVGALSGAVLGAVWNLAWPGTPLAAFAVVGATAFLASSQEMPITAVVLMVEFARIDHDTLFAVLLGVGGSAAAAYRLKASSARPG